VTTWCGLGFISNHHLTFAAAVAFIQRKLGTTPLLFQERREIHMISFQIHLFPFSAMPDHVMCEKFRDFGYIIIYKNGIIFYLKKQNGNCIGWCSFPITTSYSQLLLSSSSENSAPLLRFSKREERSIISFSDPSFPFSAMPDHVMCEKFTDFGYISYIKMDFFLKKQNGNCMVCTINVVFVSGS